VNPAAGRNWYIDTVANVDVGHVGVVVFFLISGYVIPFSIHRDAPAPARAFLVKRFFRIFPAYWLSVPLAAGAIWWLWKQPFGGRELAWNFTLLQGALGYRHVEAVYWTLPVEIVFYLLCTALLLAKSLFDARRVAILSALLLTVYALLVPTFGRPGAPLDYDGAQWFLNLSIMLWGTLYRNRVDARAALRKLDGIANALFWMLLAGYVVALPLLAWKTSTPYMRNSLWTYVIGLAIFLVGTRLVRIETRVTDWLGRISYSIYLFHVIVFMTLQWWLLRLPPGSLWRTQPIGVYVLAGLAIVLGIATLTWAFVEKPGMRLGHRLAARWEARGASGRVRVASA
jgi:peptidoglycan/LPS O-acetylase OafA/YrhL